MRYYIIEGKPDGDYNASSKARNDVEKILEKKDINKYFIRTVNGVQNNKLMKWKQFLDYKFNCKKWDKGLSGMRNNDIVFIQYPILNTTLNLDKIIKKYRNKGIIFVAIIHDLDSLRFKPEIQGKILYNRVYKEDKYLLNEFNYIIAHNNSMKNELVKLGISSDKIIELELFDYLLDKEPKNIVRTKNDPIIIAGNLSPEKAQYLGKLNTLKVNFNLFGVGYNDSMSGDNIAYKGKFKPEELLDYLEGSFGLVWDGISLDTCTGGFGEYLKYNNPHKVSLYLTAGIPVIVWSKSALAKFVIDNNVGIVIDSLNDLESKLNLISDKDYEKMLENTKRISAKTKNGQFMTDAINKVLKEK